MQTNDSTSNCLKYVEMKIFTDEEGDIDIKSFKYRKNTAKLF